MKAEWSKDWNSSIKPRKQRKFRYNAPLHIKQKFVTVHLSPELRKKYTMRSTNLRKGDKIIIIRGQHRKKKGNVDRVMLRRGKVFVEGIESVKKEGTTTQIALEPTNLMITELNLDDKKRRAKLEKNIAKEKK